jgi:hypothetical protein
MVGKSGRPTPDHSGDLAKQSSRRRPVQHYDPLEAPDPEEWLESCSRLPVRKRGCASLMFGVLALAIDHLMRLIT